jgi:cytoskeletal protein RodZ
MTIEGLGKKFQEARLARGLTLDEAARMTKIRPSRLAEIEAEDFSQFPSLAYAKGFLLIYGKFLDVDVTPYLEAFEGSENVTVDGYSYLQDAPPPKPARTPVVRRASSDRRSLMPVVIGAIVLIVGFFFMKLILNIQRIAPHRAQPATVQAHPSAPSAQPPPATASTAPAAVPAPARTTESSANKVASAVSAPSPQPARSVVSPTAVPSAAPIGLASPVGRPIAGKQPPAKEPEIRRAEPVRPEDLAKADVAATKETSTPAAESAGPNRVDIRPLKKTYVKVVVDNEATNPAFERWISPADGTVEFRGQHIAVRVLDRDAIQIRKNGKLVTDNDADITVE